MFKHRAYGIWRAGAPSLSHTALRLEEPFTKTRSNAVTIGIIHFQKERQCFATAEGLLWLLNYFLDSIIELTVVGIS